jgi:hypothetical protein
VAAGGGVVAAGGGVVAAGASLARDVGGFPSATAALIISVVIAVVTKSFFNMQSLLCPLSMQEKQTPLAPNGTMPRLARCSATQTKVLWIDRQFHSERDLIQRRIANDSLSLSPVNTRCELRGPAASTAAPVQVSRP